MQESLKMSLNHRDDMRSAIKVCSMMTLQWQSCLPGGVE